MSGYGRKGPEPGNGISSEGEVRRKHDRNLTFHLEDPFEVSSEIAQLDKLPLLDCFAPDLIQSVRRFKPRSYSRYVYKTHILKERRPM
jgi:hypothetical protein